MRVKERKPTKDQVNTLCSSVARVIGVMEVTEVIKVILSRADLQHLEPRGQRPHAEEIQSLEAPDIRLTGRQHFKHQVEGRKSSSEPHSH